MQSKYVNLVSTHVAGVFDTNFLKYTLDQLVCGLCFVLIYLFAFICSMQNIRALQNTPSNILQINRIYLVFDIWISIHQSTKCRSIYTNNFISNMFF